MAKKSKKADQSKAQAAEPVAAPPANFDSELDAFFKAAPPAPAPAPAASASTSSVAVKAGPSSSKKRKAVERPVEETVEATEEALLDDDEDDEEDDEDVEMEEGDGDLSSIDESLDDEGSLLYSQSEGEASDAEEDEEDDSEDENEPYVPPQHESVTKSQPTSTAAKNPKKTFKEAPEPSETRDQRTLFIGNLPIETAQSRSLQRKLVSLIESLSPYPILTKAHGLRFRSVAFSVPTVHLDADDDHDADKKKAKKGKTKERSQNYREAVAAVEGESAQAPLTAQQKRKIAFINKDFHEKAKSVSAYITIAHPSAVLAHLHDIAPAKAKSKGATSAGPIALDPRLTGSVLAALIAAFADGADFQGRHLRVDLVKSISPSEVLSAGLEKVKSFDGVLVGSSNSAVDPKSTLFVGGLDFETDEEEVRAFFEGLLAEEIGAAGDAITIPITGLDGKPAPSSLLESLSSEFPFVPPEKRSTTESVTRAAQFVRSVRLIHDAATQMGKGFGYVRFTSQQCVDEVMAVYNAEQAFLDSRKGVKGSLGASAAIAAGGKEFKRRLKLGGRPIRVAYCKSQTKTSTPQRGGKKGNREEEPTTPRKSPYERSSGAPTPNGTSPHVLGKRVATKITPGSPTASRSANPVEIAKKAELYATLSKDQRKQMKKDDSDRVERRMAKKNKKLGGAAAGAKVDRSLLAEGEKARSKERVKLRQPAAGSKGPKGPTGAAGGNKRFKSGPGGPPRRGPPKGK
ncbi:RNA recognition motif domain protein [Kalmanozyma brasiliensis GHG001]|uniref:RRM domain-containing protein n=1 Tax=Kalmanozyma brasiliensis (strain GHG001) TaxID=1365824 RepID=V5EVE5_KALBG|nr:RNA recognition motif domain protein [Kalmanozyma brasiliensis GHG001]EST07208.1 RNA recognition motif domain protein [Kalmanozyma brasiliensis GHG001]